METTQIKSRIYGLDIMRAVAITYVMFSHGYTYSGKFVSASYYKWLILDGVGLFFVLSGFLIGGILIKKIEVGNFESKQLFDFWIRRWMRTVPAYFCVLTLLIGAYYISHQELPPFWMRYYSFMQNFASPHPLFFGEAWSLSVEEWFYLLLPLSLFLLLKLTKQKRLLIFGFIIFSLLLIISIRLYRVEQHDYFAQGNFGDEIMKVVITRMDAIMYGVLAAWLSIYHTAKFYAYKKLLFVSGLILLVVSNILLSDFFLTRIQLILVPVATVCLLPLLSSLQNGKGRVFKCITFVSTISYAMYLTNHMIVQRGIMPFVTKWLGLDFEDNTSHNVYAYVLFWILTLLAAYSLHRIIEKPFMDLRKRLKD